MNMSIKKKSAKPLVKNISNCPCGSGKAFTACHGVPATAELPMAKPLVTLKLDLAAGQSPREGFEGVDIWPGAKHVVDLTKYPWPFEDNSVAELHSSHYIEHIPMYPLVGDNNQDPLFAFFDEAFRILVDGGTFTVICPNAMSNRGFQDPTHRRFIVAETFLYMAAEWRKMNKLDHYNVKCNYAINVNPIIPTELSALHPEVQAKRFKHEINVIMDWQAILIAQKSPPKPVIAPGPLTVLDGKS